MTDYKPGDRVRLSAAASFLRKESVGASEGTVFVDEYSEPNRTSVNWDNASVENFPHNNEIELVPTPEPTPEPTPADPDLQALRERLLDKAIGASSFDPGADTLIAAAKAFEAYVTGGTE